MIELAKHKRPMRKHDEGLTESIAQRLRRAAAELPLHGRVFPGEPPRRSRWSRGHAEAGPRQHFVPHPLDAA